MENCWCAIANCIGSDIADGLTEAACATNTHTHTHTTRTHQTGELSERTNEKCACTIIRFIIIVIINITRHNHWTECAIQLTQLLSPECIVLTSTANVNFCTRIDNLRRPFSISFLHLMKLFIFTPNLWTGWLHRAACLFGAQTINLHNNVQVTCDYHRLVNKLPNCCQETQLSPIRNFLQKSWTESNQMEQRKKYANCQNDYQQNAKKRQINHNHFNLTQNRNAT